MLEKKTEAGLDMRISLDPMLATHSGQKVYEAQRDALAMARGRAQRLTEIVLRLATSPYGASCSNDYSTLQTPDVERKQAEQRVARLYAFAEVLVDREAEVLKDAEGSQ
jgi:hypothetical protein